MPPPLREIVISREKAVFWMDARGRWHNEHGIFEHPKIIAHFNAHIRWDEDGYFLSQVINDHIEKVYFPYVDTALFAIDLRGESEEELILNTGAKLPLDPSRLAMKGDVLYQLFDDQRVKFSERCLIKLAERIEVSEGEYLFNSDQGRHPIATLSGEGG